MSYKHQQIQINRHGVSTFADIYYRRDNRCSLKIVFDDGTEHQETGCDIFSCFCKLRHRFQDTTFNCKGARINVYPTGASRNISGGLLAYQLQQGQPLTKQDLVYIFDPDDTDLVLPIEQKDYYLQWAQSACVPA